MCRPCGPLSPSRIVTQREAGAIDKIPAPRRNTVEASDAAKLERITLRKVYLRLVPYCFVLYILCYIDRINVSFAALTMNKDLGLTRVIAHQNMLSNRVR